MRSGRLGSDAVNLWSKWNHYIFEEVFGDVCFKLMIYQSHFMDGGSREILDDEIEDLHRESMGWPAILTYFDQ